MKKEIMNFGEFTNAVLESIKAYLSESFAGADISLQTINKNNDIRLTSLNIRLADNNICPIIYLEIFYDYKKSESLDEVLTKIAEIRVYNEIRETFEIDIITDFDKAKKHLVPRLISRDKNKILLEERPH